MSDDYTPTTGEVRADYIRDHTRNFDSYMVGRSLTSEQEFYGDKFDLWLDSVIAEKRAEWEAEQGETGPSDQIKQLLRDLVDPDECWFDHHGGCQAHGYLSLKPGELCPHAEAKHLLAGWLPVPDTGAES